MNRFRIVKYTAYSIEILLALVWQATPYLLPEIFGGKAVLLILPALTIAIFEPEVPAMIFALVCGLLADCSYGGALGFYAIAFIIMAFIVSILNGSVLKTSLFTAMLEAVAAVPVMIILQFLFYYVFAGYSDAGYFFFSHYLSRMIYTLALVPLFYGLNKLLNKRLGR